MKATKALFLLLLCALLPLNAYAATEEFSGSVVWGQEVSITAPISGTVTETFCRTGQWVNEGDVLAAVQTTGVFAPMDGTIGAIETEPGESADGTVVTLYPVSKYTITASTDDLYGVSEAARYYIHLGETLYIRCTKDRSHVAVGSVTAVNGSSFTVETTGGELYLEEEVNLYRDANYSHSFWIGTGTVARTEAHSLTGNGTLLDVLVVPGQKVERGQLLFTCVPGAADDYTPKDGLIRANRSGVVASFSLAAGTPVQKGMAVATLYPRENFLLAVTVPEDLLRHVHEGTPLRFYLDWNEDEPRWYEATVNSLSFETDQMTGEGSFVAYATFAADDSVRLNMSAVVEVEVP